MVGSAGAIQDPLPQEAVGTVESGPMNKNVTWNSPLEENDMMSSTQELNADDSHEEISSTQVLETSTQVLETEVTQDSLAQQYETLLESLLELGTRTTIKCWIRSIFSSMALVV